MPCKDCGGTGRILLLNHYVDCDCQKQPQIQMIDLLVDHVKDCFRMFGNPMLTFKEIEGTAVACRKLRDGEYRNVIQASADLHFRLTMGCTVKLGDEYSLWLYKNPDGVCKIQPRRKSEKK